MTPFLRSISAIVLCACAAPLQAAPPKAEATGGTRPDAEAPAGETRTAQSIPSLPGFVRSPYTNPPQLVNVKDAEPGSTVICPYTKRPFIVPMDINNPVTQGKGSVAKGREPVAKDAAKAPKAGEPRVSSTNLKTPPELSGKTVKDAAVVQPERDTAWRFTVGPQWREIGKVDWQTGSAAASSPLPWLAGRGRNSGSSAGGSSNIPSGAGDHTYDDGFVNQDGATFTTGTTWFWGYDNASQVQGNDLVFHADSDTAFSRFSRSASSHLRKSSWSDDLSGAGVFAKLESPELLRYEGVGISFELAYSWAHDDTAKYTRDLYRAEQSSRLVTGGGGSIEDRYDVTGILLPLAPYEGTFTGPGVTIPNAPYSRTVSGGEEFTETRTASFSSDVRESFEVDLHTLSFGPRINWECCQDVRLGLGLGLALNIADWDADYEETLSVRQNGHAERVLKRWAESESGTEVLAGFYLEAMCQVQLAERLAAYFAGRYDWSEDMSERVGPSRVSFEPGGWSIMAGLTLSL
jgi:hypothetical protein